jgi:serine/threonine protein kinase
MALPPGTKLGAYEIQSLLGAGGMGEVYRARDTRLDRLVAVKILLSEKVADPERKRRFVQEAKAASSLNHPNIVTIYSIDQAEGVDFIAMEYVAGKTLERLIPRGGMGVKDVLQYAVQIADALARAHAAGIVHRDLKPGNIMVDEHGLVKVLDFGLAKLTERTSTGSDEETLSVQPKTEEGKIVGTVAYMSPEQAEGKAVDTRSDIFSFGSVLFEMATGRRAFSGETRASTLAAILKDNPPPARQLADTLPREVERLISRCLRKDPNQRFQHMDDVKIVLQELKEESDSGVLGAAAPAQKSHFRWLWPLSLAAALAVAAGLWLRSRERPVETPLVAVPLTSYPGDESTPTLSPDGSQVAFAWNGEKQNKWDIYVKQIGVEPPFRLTNDAATNYSPAWSPDGGYIAFLREATPDRTAIVRVPQRGGPERIVAEIKGSVGQLPYGPYLSWTPDSKWIVCPAPRSGQRVWALHLFSTENGEDMELTDPPSDEAGDVAPAVSPDGGTLIFSRVSPDFHNATLWSLPLGKGYKPSEKEHKLEARGLTNIGAAWLPQGSEFVFASGTETDYGLWRTSASKGAPFQRISLGVSSLAEPTISRLGNRLAFSTFQYDLNIWRIDLKGPNKEASQPISFISSTQVEQYPAYSADGKHIAYMSTRSGTEEIWVCESDGSNAAQVTSFGGAAIYGPSWSPDGKNIAFTVALKDMKEDIYVVSANGGAPRRMTTDPAEDKWPSWSRDGKWIYFASTRSGREEIWKIPSSGGEAIQITRDSGDEPEESADGKTVYYMKGWPSEVSVWRANTDGSHEARVLQDVHSEGQWTVVQDGIYFFKTPDKAGSSNLDYYELASGQTRKLISIPRPIQTRIAVSPDGRTVLYPQSDRSGSVLMLVERFH